MLTYVGDTFWKISKNIKTRKNDDIVTENYRGNAGGTRCRAPKTGFRQTNFQTKEIARRFPFVLFR